MRDMAHPIDIIRRLTLSTRVALCVRSSRQELSYKVRPDGFNVQATIWS